MREVVIVPAWRRPEFLRAALTRLIAADEPNLSYWVCLDRGHSPEVRSVANWFVKRIGRGRALFRRVAHHYKGNSYNLLYAYRDACDQDFGLIHLVEEDVFVAKDYFDAHRRIHDLFPDAFSVSTCRNQQHPPGSDPPHEEDAAYLEGSYQSIGVSFRPERMKLAIPHVRPQYFLNPVRYCKRRFPDSQINPANAEQDGLLHRILEEERLQTAYASVPRAYHAGFIGYHRKGVPLEGSVEERSKRLLEMSAEELNARSESYPDHTVVPLDGDRKPITRAIQWP